MRTALSKLDQALEWGVEKFLSGIVYVVIVVGILDIFWCAA